MIDINKKTKNELNNKISNEKIYTYPYELDLIKDSNSIIKIDNYIISKIINKHSIGYVQINKIVKTPIKTYKSVFNPYTKKFEIKEYIEFDEYKKKISSQILFPDIDPKIILDPDLLLSKKINVLLDNNSFIKSTNKNIIERYEKIIQKNIKNFKSDIFIEDNYFNLTNLELQENILSENKNLYLLVNPFNNKLNINTISDSENNIIKEKYKSDINYVENINFLSYTFIGLGVIFGIFNIKKN